MDLLEDRNNKKKKQQKEKVPSEGKTKLQRSKTFVNLLFKKDPKEKKSQNQHTGKGGMLSRSLFSFFYIYIQKGFVSLRFIKMSHYSW